MPCLACDARFLLLPLASLQGAASRAWQARARPNATCYTALTHSPPCGRVRFAAKASKKKGKKEPEPEPAAPTLAQKAAEASERNGERSKSPSHKPLPPLVRSTSFATQTTLSLSLRLCFSPFSPSLSVSVCLCLSPPPPPPCHLWYACSLQQRLPSPRLPGLRERMSAILRKR